MVQSLLWSKSFVLGHQGLDDEHRRIVELINDVIATVQSKKAADPLLNLLKALRNTTVEHLRNENAVLWELRSGTYERLRDRPRTPHFLKVMAEAAFDEHMAEHENLLAQFDRVCTLPLDALCEALKSWFLDHAINQDSHLKAIFRAMH
jgi:hemerythrin